MKEEAGLETASSQCKFLNHRIVSVLAFLTVRSESPPDTAGSDPCTAPWGSKLPSLANEEPELPGEELASSQGDKEVLQLSYKENLGHFNELEPDFSLADLLLLRLVYFASLECVKIWREPGRAKCF